MTTVSARARSAAIVRDGAVLAAGAAAGAILALAAYFVSPVAALVLAAAVVIVLLVLSEPLLGVAGGLLLVPLESLNIQAGAAAGVTPAEALFFLAAGSATLRIVAGPLPRNIAGAHLAFAALIAAVAAGAFFTLDLAVLGKIVVAWTVFLLLSIHVSGADERQVRHMVAVIVASCAALAALAVAGAGDLELRAGGAQASNRATGAFNHPNLLAMYLGLGLPLAIVSAIQARGVWRVVGAAATCLILAALLLTLSRAAILASVVAVGMLLAWPAFRRTLAVGVIVVIVTAPLGLAPLLESRDASIIRTRLGTITQERDTNPRLRIYSMAPEMIADRPVLGFGIGSFARWSPDYGMRDRYGVPFAHAHNVALTIAVEAGLLGLAALAAFFWQLASLARRVVRVRRSPLHGVGVALVAAFAATAVVSLTDYPLRSNPVTALFMIEVGLLVAVASSMTPTLAAKGGGARRSKGE